MSPKRRSSRIAARLGIQLPLDVEPRGQRDIKEKPQKAKRKRKPELDHLNTRDEPLDRHDYDEDDIHDQSDSDPEGGFGYNYFDIDDEFDYSNGLLNRDPITVFLRAPIETFSSNTREANNATSQNNEPSQPLEPSPDKTYICTCGQPATKFLCRNGRPENVGKYYFTCARRNEGGCRYWEWIETANDRLKRDDYRTHIRPKPYDRPNNDGPQFKCRCGLPPRQLVSRNGMPHNYGRPFLVCASRKCGFWIWADGTLPFSDDAQARFDEWADSVGICSLFGDCQSE